MQALSALTQKVYLPAWMKGKWTDQRGVGVDRAEGEGGQDGVVLAAGGEAGGAAGGEGDGGGAGLAGGGVEGDEGGVRRHRRRRRRDGQWEHGHEQTNHEGGDGQDPPPLACARSPYVGTNGQVGAHGVPPSIICRYRAG